MSINEKNILTKDASNIIDRTFGDLNGVYPKNQYSVLNLPDVNVLGSERGGGNLGNLKPIISNPQALDPKQSVHDRQAVGIPEPFMGGSYPYTKVEETESGHKFVKSDSPGDETILTAHRTGTYTEYRPDGSFVTSIRGKGYFATADDHTIIVKGACKIVIEGDLDISVGGNYNLNVAGDFNMTVAGDARNIVSGGMNEEVHGPKSETYGKEFSQIVAGDHYQLIAGNQDIGVAGNFAHTTSGTTDIASKGNMSLDTQGAQRVSSKSDQEINSQAKQQIAAGGDQKVFTGANQIVASGGTQDITSSGNQNITAGSLSTYTSPSIGIGSGVVIVKGAIGLTGGVEMTGDLRATPSPTTWPGSTFNAEMPMGEIYSTGAPIAAKEKKLPKSQEIRDEHTNWNTTKGAIGSDFSVDHMNEIQEDYGEVPQEMVKTAIKKGIVTSWPEQGSYESAPGNIGSSSGMSWSSEEKLGNAHNNVFNSPGQNSSIEIEPDTSTISTDGSFKLSKYFTLSQLTASRAGGRIRSHNGVSSEDIVKNLMYLATNVLDPIYEYTGGKMYITSGYRSEIVNGSSSRSQHMIGQAADIKFPDMGADQYYHVAQWIRDNLNFDQLILESTASSMWIHVSYKPGGNRKSVFTQYNHKPIGSGLIAGKPSKGRKKG